MSFNLLIILVIITLIISLFFYFALTKATIKLYIKNRGLILAPEFLLHWFDKNPLRNIKLFYLGFDILCTALTLFLIFTLYFG